LPGLYAWPCTPLGHQETVSLVGLDSTL